MNTTTNTAQAVLSSAQPSNSGRDSAGRFAKNNAGGLGNPFAGSVAKIRKALFEQMTAENIRAIMEKLLELAKDGHFPAIKLILSYTLGKPGSVPDLTQSDAAVSYFSPGAAQSAGSADRAEEGRPSVTGQSYAEHSADCESGMGLKNLSERLDLLDDLDKHTVADLLNRATAEGSQPLTNGIFSDVGELRIVPEKTASGSPKSSQKRSRRQRRRKG